MVLETQGRWHERTYGSGHVQPLSQNDGAIIGHHESRRLSSWTRRSDGRGEPESAELDAAAACAIGPLLACSAQLPIPYMERLMIGVGAGGDDSDLNQPSARRGRICVRQRPLVRQRCTNVPNAAADTVPAERRMRQMRPSGSKAIDRPGFRCATGPDLGSRKPA